MRVIARSVCAVALLIGVTACSSGVTGTAAVGTNTPTTAASTTPTTRSNSGASASATVNSDTLASGVTIEELKDDLDLAPKIVDAFWAKHWADYYTGTYTSPNVYGVYDGSDPASTPLCGGEPLDAYNAQYCSDGDFVAWDASLLVDGADQIGDSWVYLVVAHEWGHAVQARLDPSLVASAYELQADCLGAAALYGAVADGTLQFDMGDDTELITSLTALADQMPWTMSSDHGDPFQRVQWFTLGRNNGVNGCHDVLETSTGPVATAPFNDSVAPQVPTTQPAPPTR
jgi:predicted metalloprotease